MLRTSTARLSHNLALQSGSVKQSAPSAGNTIKKGHWAAPYKITHNVTANNYIEEKWLTIYVLENAWNFMGMWQQFTLQSSIAQ